MASVSVKWIAIYINSKLCCILRYPNIYIYFPDKIKKTKTNSSTKFPPGSFLIIAGTSKIVKLNIVSAM